MAGTGGTVYLLHFDRPYKHARHYIGWALDVRRRLTEHAAGRGAHLMSVIKDAGITWQLARTWPGDRNRERAIKRKGGASRCCPLCGVRPHARPAAELPRNRDGSLSRSRITDREKLLAGVMTAAQLAAHTALRRLGSRLDMGGHPSASAARELDIRVQHLPASEDAGRGSDRQLPAVSDRKSVV